MKFQHLNVGPLKFPRWDLPVVDPELPASGGALVEANAEAEEGTDTGEATADAAADTAQDAMPPPPPPPPVLSQEELDLRQEYAEEVQAIRTMFAIQLAKNATTAAVATTMRKIEDEWRASEKLRWEEIHKAGSGIQ